MNRTLKAIAALMLMMVFAVGCKKEGSYKGHEYIDLGLPSGTLWATCNVGANTPEDYGDFFAWGEIETKEVFTLENYKYFEGDSITKYNHFDGLTLLQEEDDAASANWGSGWHTPTEDNWWELVNNTTQTWIVRNGVSGRLFTASNGGEVFIPANIYTLSENFSVQGQYWMNHGGGGLVMPFFCLTSEVCMVDVTLRYLGLFVRPVRSTH